MNKEKRDFNNAKDKFSGKAKETVGKITGNEQLELKGKVQSSKADVKINVEKKVDKIKEGIAGKINDKTDKKKK